MRTLTIRTAMTLTFLVGLLGVGCDRLPEMGTEGRPCFGNGTCSESDLVCIPGEEVCCRPDCTNKCGGAPDECAGTCDDACPTGMFCAGQECSACAEVGHCGPDCSDCVSLETNWSCVPADGGWRCGCASGDDCSSGDCGGDGRCVVCTPDCAGKACGVDNGCGTPCVTDTCGPGEFCQGDTDPPCQPCAVAEHCGADCRDCAQSGTGGLCIDTDMQGVFYCGCIDYQDCQAGQMCDSGLHLCHGDSCCGLGCVDCSQQVSNQVCVESFQFPGEYECGCTADADCDEGMGETCLDSLCSFQGTLCEDDADCNGTDCTQQNSNKVCVDATGTGSCQCGCDQGGDCALFENCAGPDGITCVPEETCLVDDDCVGPGEVCFQGECCLPSCLPGQCDVDDSCGGSCGCEPGLYCNGGNCQSCTVDQACGDNCHDCAFSILGHKCIQPGGGYVCGCTADADCLSGTCAGDACSNMSLLYNLDTAAHGCVMVSGLALADLSGGLGGETLFVGCGGGSGSRPILVYRLDGALDAPEHVLIAPGVHEADITAVGIDEASGDVYSADMDGHWYRWVWNDASESYDPPEDLAISTGVSGYLLETRSNPFRVAVGTDVNARNVQVFDDSLTSLQSYALGHLLASLAFDASGEYALYGTVTGSMDDGLVVQNLTSGSSSSFGSEFDVYALDTGAGGNGYSIAAQGYDNSVNMYMVYLFVDVVGDVCAECTVLSTGAVVMYDLASTVDDTVIWVGLASGEIRGFNPFNSLDSGPYQAHPGCSYSVVNVVDEGDTMATSCGAEVRVWSPAVLAEELSIAGP